MSFQFTNTSYIREKEIDWKKLKTDFMPGFQKEIECYKRAIIHGGKDAITGKKLPPTSWPRDLAPGELAYYNFLKRSTDDDMNWNTARDDRGNEIKGTGARYVIDGIIRVRTVKGEFLVSYGRLEGYDEIGNKTGVSCHCPEQWIEIHFNYQMGLDQNNRPMRQCTGPSGNEIVYDLPFSKENVKKLAKLRAGDSIPFTLKDETGDNRPRSIPLQGSFESRIEFFMKPFDYLYNAEYMSKEDKAWARKIDELILSGKAKDEQHAAEIAELEIEEKKPPNRNDAKTEVA